MNGSEITLESTKLTKWYLALCIWVSSSKIRATDIPLLGIS